VTVGVSRQRRLVLAVVAAGLFLAALDTYVVVTVLPRMMFDLALPIDRIEQATPIVPRRIDCGPALAGRRPGAAGSRWWRHGAGGAGAGG
jgi:hypothetical protein